MNRDRGEPSGAQRAPAAPELGDLERARARIADHVRTTPVIRSAALSERVGAEIVLKLETEQITGAFKVRGAANKIVGLSPAEKARGVVAVSTGNHGRAVAHVAAALGIRAVVCLSRAVPAHKVEAIRALGAELHRDSADQDRALEHARTLVEAEGLTFVPPFDDPAVVAGQGTVGLELLEQVPDLDTVLAPLSGGGLLGGIAVAVKSLRPSARVIGVSAARVSVMLQSLRAGRLLELPERASLADSLAGGIGPVNDVTFALVRDRVDDHRVVDEEAIAEAMAFAWREHGLALEGAAAVGIAALLRSPPPPGRTIAVVLSGGNVDRGRLAAIVGDDPSIE